MSENTIEYYFDQIIDMLNNKSSEFRKVLHIASDIDDPTESGKLWSSTRRKVSRITDFIAKVEEIKDEILDSGLLDQDTDNTEISAEQIPAENKGTEHISSESRWLPLDSDFTHKKVKKFSFNNKIYSVRSYTGAYVKICELLYDLNKGRFKQMINEDYLNRRKLKLFSRDDSFRYPGNNINYYKKMRNADLYVWINIGSERKTSLISYMLKYFNLPKETVEFLLEDDNSEQMDIDDIILSNEATAEPFYDADEELTQENYNDKEEIAEYEPAEAAEEIAEESQGPINADFFENTDVNAENHEDTNSNTLVPEAAEYETNSITPEENRTAAADDLTEEIPEDSPEPVSADLSENTGINTEYHEDADINALMQEAIEAAINSILPEENHTAETESIPEETTEDSHEQTNAAEPESADTDTSKRDAEIAAIRGIIAGLQRYNGIGTPEQITVGSKKYNVSGWSDVLIKTYESLISRFPYDIMLFAEESPEFIRNQNEALRNQTNPCKLSNGYYINRCTDRDHVLKMLGKALYKCKLNQNYIDIK